MQTFRLPNRPKPLAEVADRFHLTPLIRVMTSPHDAFVLALSEERVRLLHVIVNSPPVEIKIAQLPKSAEQATRRPSIHVRAPRGRLQNLEGQKVLLHQYARRIDQALQSVLAEENSPSLLAAAEPLASIFRKVNTYRRLVDDAIAGNPDHLSDARLGDATFPVLERLHRRELDAIIALFHELKPRYATDDLSPEDYDAVFYPGGHGPLWDLAENKISIKLIEAMHAAGKPIAAVCHGPGVFRHTKASGGSPLVEGKSVTGFANTEEAAVGLTDVVPFLVEDMLKANGGVYSKGADWQLHVVVDGGLITGQNPASSEGGALALLDLLKHGALSKQAFARTS